MQTITNAQIYAVSLVDPDTLPYPWNEICRVEIVNPEEKPCSE